MPLDHLLIVAFVLFVVGAAGVMVRRNLIVVLMSIELMLNAVNLAFVSFSRQMVDHDGQVMVLMIFVVAAVEVAIGMAILVNMYRQKRSLSVDVFHSMRG
ncbi:MAG TPA: NADH-quinone oxidoreductase subunit NuoK [Deltaproteobacteria bacterium]|nr:NADH-quinone oxidoreductase subunit NuoK [Deltaproteobacteria bacterium]HCP45384.1 NADH-quinone oxidoreductase subunit NuoK [Deltaproteobacteria bacterium]|tara:strand:+ start:1279 stop:1578 length:300 start_codon:yes stop_codon:yes gene_type:complete